MFQQSGQTPKLKKYSNTLTRLQKISPNSLCNKEFGVKFNYSRPFEIPVSKESCKTERLLLRLDHFRERDYGLIVESQLITFSHASTDCLINGIFSYSEFHISIKVDQNAMKFVNEMLP